MLVQVHALVLLVLWVITCWSFESLLSTNRILSRLFWVANAVIAIGRLYSGSNKWCIFVLYSDGTTVHNTFVSFLATNEVCGRWKRCIGPKYSHYSEWQFSETLEYVCLKRLSFKVSRTVVAKWDLRWNNKVAGTETTGPTQLQEYPHFLYFLYQILDCWLQVGPMDSKR